MWKRFKKIINWKDYKSFNDLLNNWKPIHLCWWFEKHNLPIPKYFIAGSDPPSVTTNACSDVLGTSATGNGEVTAEGSSSVTSRGFCYIPGTSGDPTTANDTVSEAVSGTGIYDLSITGLDAETDYRVRAYAINSKGTGYGTTVQLTTAAGPITDSYTGNANLIVNTSPTVVLNSPAIEIDIYDFDGSDVAVSDPNNDWNDDTKAYDGLDTTYTYTGVGTTTGGLIATGTNSPTTGGVISLVEVRLRAGSNITPANWGSYVTLTIPTGGWTWQKVSALQAIINVQSGNANEIYASIKSGAQTLASDTILANGDSGTSWRAYKLEARVTSAPTTSDTTPDLEFTGTDPDEDEIEYNIQIDTVNTFDSQSEPSEPLDADSAWDDDVNVFDGSLSTYTYAVVAGTPTTKLLIAGGTDAPSTGDTITQVRARMYRDWTDESSGGARIYTDAQEELLGIVYSGYGTGWSPYYTLDSPSGGWTWAKIQSLEANLYSYSSGEFGNNFIYKIEIEVTAGNVTSYYFDCSDLRKPLLDKLSETPDDTFINTEDGGDTHPFTSEQRIRYTVQNKPTIDRYSESHYVSYVNLWYDQNESVAQSFTGNGKSVISAKFYLKSYGSPPGNVTAYLYSHSGTYGTSSVPDTLLATSNTISAISIDTSMELVEFTFSTPYETINGTKYCIVFEYNDIGGDGNNMVSAGFDSSPEHGGNYSQYSVGTWVANADKDLIFYVYGGDESLDADTYYWRVKGKDPDGTNTHGTWSDTYSFTVTSGETHSDTYSGDANLEKNILDSYTGDSNLKGVLSSSYTGDANLKSIESAAYSGDSNLKREISSTFNGDSNIKKSLENQFNGDSNLKSIESDSFSGDSILITRHSDSITSDSSLLKTITSTYTSDASLLISIKTSFTGDSNIKKVNTSTYTGDSSLKGVLIDSFTANSNLKINLADQFSGNSNLLGNISTIYTGDASLKEILINQFSGGSNLKEIIASSYTGDATIVTRHQNTFTGNGNLKDTLEQSFSSNASLKEIIALDITSDANLKITITEQFIGNSNLSTTLSPSFTGNASCLLTSGDSFLGDASIKEILINQFVGAVSLKIIQTETYIGDALIITCHSNTYLGNSNLLETLFLDFSGNASLRKEIVDTFVGNTNLIKFIEASLTGDSYLILGIQTHSASYIGESNLKETISTTFLGNSSLKEILVNQFIGDSSIKTTLPNSYTGNTTIVTLHSNIFAGDSNLKKTLGNSCTSDTSILSTILEEFNGNSNLKRTIAQSFSGNSNIKETLTNFFLGDSVICNTYINTFNGNASIKKIITTTFSGQSSTESETQTQYSGDANLLKIIASSFTADASIHIGLLNQFLGNANLNIILSSFFTSDSSLKKIIEDSILTNANILKIAISDSFTSDALIQTIYLEEFTADASIKEIILSSYIGDSNLLSVLDHPFTGEASLKIILQNQLTADASILQIVSETYTANANLINTETRQFTGDANLNILGTTQFSGNASIKINLPQSFTGNSNLKLKITDTFSGSIFSQELTTKAFNWGIPGGGVYVYHVNNPANKQAICFTPSITLPVSRIHLRLLQIQDSPVYRFGIQADSSGNPSGTYLSSATETPITEGVHTITIPTITLTKGTKYWIVIQWESGTCDSTHTMGISAWAFKESKYSYGNYPEGTIGIKQYITDQWYDEETVSTPGFIVDDNNYYYEGIPYMNWGAGRIYGTRYRGETFRLNRSINIDKISAYILKEGSPPSDCFYKIIRKSNNEVLTSGILATAAGVLTTPTKVTATLGSTLTLNKDVSYRFIIYTNNGDTSNYYDIIGWTIPDTTTSHLTYNGVLNHFTLSNDSGASWNDTYTDWDMWFDLTTIQNESFNGNSSLQSSAPLTYLGNANLKKKIATSFLGDCNLKDSISNSYTGDANIKKIIELSFTGDSSIKEILTNQFGGDSNILKSVTQTLLGDAIVVTKHQDTFTGNSSIKEIIASSLTANSNLLKNISETFRGDANIKSIPGNQFSGDASIKVIIDDSFTADSTVVTLHTDSLTSNASVLKVLSSTYLSNANILKRITASFTGDALIEAILSNQFLGSSSILKIVSDTLTGDSTIVTKYEEWFTGDANIEKEIPSTYTADASILKIVAESFTGNSNILGQTPETFLSGASLLKIIVDNFSSDANIKAIIPTSFIGNASIRDILLNQFIGNANILQTISDVFAGDSSLIETEDTTFTGNASILKIINESFSGQVSILLVIETSFVGNSNILKIVTNNFFGDSNLVGPIGLTTFSGDTSILKILSESFTGNSSLKSILANSFQGNANLLNIFTDTFNGNANLKSIPSNSFTADSLLITISKNIWTGNSSIKAIVQNSYLGDSLVITKIDNDFTGNASILKTVSQFKTQETFQPSTKDTKLWSSVPDTNYGSDNNLQIWIGGTNLIHFDISSIPDNTIFIQGEISLYCYHLTSPNFPYLNRLTQLAWTEDGATWNKYDGVNEWNVPGGDFTITNRVGTTLNQTGWHTWSSAQLIQDCYNNQSKNIHLLISTTESTGNGNFLCSKQWGDPSQRPKLTVTYTTGPLAFTGNANLKKEIQENFSGNSSLKSIETTQFNSNSNLLKCVNICGATTTYQPTIKDTQLAQNNPTTNYGGSTSIKIGYRLSWKTYWNSLFNWDLSNIPSLAEFSQGDIQFYVNSGGAAGLITVYARRILQIAWTEDGATWNKYDGVNEWSTGGCKGNKDRTTANQASVAFTTSHIGFKTISGISLIQDCFDNQAKHVNIVIQEDAVINGDSNIDSRENITEANRPKLTVAWISALGFTGNASIKKEISNLYTGDSNVGITYKDQFSGDSSIKKVIDTSYTGNANLTVINTNQFTGDSNLTKEVQNTFLGLANILKTVQLDITGDSLIVRTVLDDFTGDANIHGILQNQFTSDSYLRTGTPGYFIRGLPIKIRMTSYLGNIRMTSFEGDIKITSLLGNVNV